MNAIIPGSFDPITLGHVDIIERAAKVFDKLYVAVMNNDSAEHDNRLFSKTYLFDMKQRLEIVRLSLSHLTNVEVIASAGMLIDLCDRLDTHIIVKGIRTCEDLEYEMIHAKWNKEHNPLVETLFLPCSEGLSSVSSTAVRDYIKDRDFDDLSRYMHPAAINYIKNLTMR